MTRQAGVAKKCRRGTILIQKSTLPTTRFISLIRGVEGPFIAMAVRLSRNYFVSFCCCCNTICDFLDQMAKQSFQLLTHYRGTRLTRNSHLNQCSFLETIYLAHVDTIRKYIFFTMKEQRTGDFCKWKLCIFYSDRGTFDQTSHPAKMTSGGATKLGRRNFTLIFRKGYSLKLHRNQCHLDGDYKCIYLSLKSVITFYIGTFNCTLQKWLRGILQVCGARGCSAIPSHRIRRSTIDHWVFECYS